MSHEVRATHRHAYAIVNAQTAIRTVAHDASTAYSLTFVSNATKHGTKSAGESEGFYHRSTSRYATNLDGKERKAPPWANMEGLLTSLGEVSELTLTCNYRGDDSFPSLETATRRGTTLFEPCLTASRSSSL